MNVTHVFFGRLHFLDAFALEAREHEGLAGPGVAAQLVRKAEVKTLVASRHGPWIDPDGTRERVIADVGAIFNKGRTARGAALMSFVL